MQTTQLKEEICKALDSKKALDVTCVALEGLTTIADWFVIASGRSTTQVKALAENLEEIMEKQYGVTVLRTDGRSGGKWIVLDYGSVIVHIFEEETRKTYSLEQLWGDGSNVARFEGDAE